ncbi:hypothetical protein [Polaromonas glacialis]|uniref:hypothetical protein n=1 Tax=Polaromonas glacialis TaxID=866564 RepID=UPI00049802BC|nr:hypothetical protein [Polaromonas glacialis]
MMMQPPGTPKREDAALQQLWRQVCASRGTPAPDAAQLAGFIEDLGALEREKLESVLLLAARGREPAGELSVLSWAAACTRPALLDQLQTHGLGFTSAGLFACGLGLREKGWDMQQRIAQLQSHPADVDTLRAWAPAALPLGPGQAQEDPPKEVDPDSPEDSDLGQPFFAWPDDGDNGSPEGQTPGSEGEPMDAMDESPAASNLEETPPVLPTRFARQRPDALAGPASVAGGTPHELRLRMRLFGKAAAHTLEVTPHRRGGDFMGMHVVSIDSAHALGAGGGYAWERKLVIQLTPEEMPAVIATLMGLTHSVRLGHHGAVRDKFLEVRRQDGGLVMVTGEKALSYSVPVPTATLYYVLDLFCRAMSMGTEENKPGRSVADVLMLVRSAHGV